MACIRVFCTASTLPSLRDCLGFAAGAGEGVILAIDIDDIAAVDADSSSWSAVRLLYREDASPLAVTVTRDTDTAPDFRTTLQHFLAALDGNTDARASMVRAHLAATRAIVTVALPASPVPPALPADPDETDETDETNEDALESVAWFTRIFVEQYGGLLQADGDGFYDRDNDLILALL